MLHMFAVFTCVFPQSLSMLCFETGSFSESQTLWYSFWVLWDTFFSQAKAYILWASSFPFMSMSQLSHIVKSSLHQWNEIVTTCIRNKSWRSSWLCMFANLVWVLAHRMNKQKLPCHLARALCLLLTSSRLILPVLAFMYPLACKAITTDRADPSALELHFDIA